MEESDGIISLNRICRACLNERTQMKPLFDARLADMMMACANIVLVEGDGLPAQLCLQCVTSVSRAFYFKELCEKNDNTLRQLAALNQPQQNYEEPLKYQLLNVVVEYPPDLSQTIGTNLLLQDGKMQTETIQIQEIEQDADTSTLFIEPVAPSPIASESMQDDQLSNKINQKLIDLQEIILCPGINYMTEPDPQQSQVQEQQTMAIENISISRDPSGSVDCPQCGKSLKGPKVLARHMKTHLTVKPYSCEVCNKGFPESGSLAKHMRRHKGEKPHMCNICGKRFYESNVLTMHMRTHTGEKPFCCPDCGKRFAQSGQLDIHRKTHLVDKPNVCEICHKGFTLPWQLKIHMRVHTAEKPHACTFCNKRFAQGGNLTIHLRTHTGEKPYICTICGKGHASSGELQVHNRKHTGEKPKMKAVCNICGKQCPNNSEMRVHMRSHTGEKPFVCDICNKSFVLSSHLIVHMRSHTGERPYVCGICSKGFASSSMLKKHTFVHTGEKPYECNVCGKRFSQPGARSTHIKSVHEKSAMKLLGTA